MGSVSKHKLGIDDHFPLISYQNQQSYQIFHFGSQWLVYQWGLQTTPARTLISVLE